MGLTPAPEHRRRHVEPQSQEGWVTTRLDFLVNWGRANSLWPMPFGTACCAIEFMATAASRFDLARFGMERMSFSPRQADVLICAGRVPFKLAPVIRRIWQQMPQPKWCISMGACASTGGMFDNYAVVQGIDTIIPVDVYVPGCPPRPEGLMYGIMMLQEKVKSERMSDESLRNEMEPDPTSQLYIPPSADRRAVRAVRQLGAPDAVRPVSATFVTGHRRARATAERRRARRRRSNVPHRGGAAESVGRRAAQRSSATRCSASTWCGARRRCIVDAARVLEIMRWLHDDPSQRYDYLSDVTAVEYRDLEQPIEVVWHLRSLPYRRFLRAQGAAPEGRSRSRCRACGPIYKGADWLERECYDMFGISSTGIPTCAAS